MGLPATGKRISRANGGLAAVGAMILRYRNGGRFTSDYEIARISVALRDLRVRDDAWARMDPAHADAYLRLWTDVVRRAQPGHVAPAAPCSRWRAVVSLRSWRDVIRTIYPRAGEEMGTVYPHRWAVPAGGLGTAVRSG